MLRLTGFACTVGCHPCRLTSMKDILTIAAVLATTFAVQAELPTSGFRAVKGGASPDGRWVVCVLDSSGVEFVDELPEPNRSAYLVDLGKMAAVAKIP